MKTSDPNSDKEVAKDIKITFPQIELKPHCFKAYLKAIGFKLINIVEKTEDEQKLEKVIYIYMKI